jgi:hypothetical protein
MSGKSYEFRVILALVVLGVGVGWVAKSAFSHGDSHHLSADIETDDDDSESKVTGSGHVTEVTREIGTPHAIELEGAYTAEITIGDKPSLRISADDNIIPLIETTTDDGTLTVSYDRKFSTKSGPKLFITVPSLDSLKLETSNVTIAGLNGGSFSLKIEGASDVRASGTVEKASINIAGAGSVKFAKLDAADVSIDMAGAGKAEVTARETLDVAIAGAGSVVYSGSPKTVNKRIAGFGTVSAAS